MRAITVLILVAVLIANVYSIEEPVLLGWHLKIGMVEAERIKRVEDRMFIKPVKPIVGGYLAPVNAHPYLAGIVIDMVGFEGHSNCGGSLITATRVLTAAHCWYDGRFQAWRFTVVLGSQYLFHGGIRIPTNHVVLHALYSPKTFANDIAMIYLPVSVPSSPTIHPIALPGASLQQNAFVGIWAQAAGFGRYSELSTLSYYTTLRHVFLQVITNDQCRSVFGNVIFDSTLCTNGAGGVGICQGDSGGPLTINVNGQPVLIGISSFVAHLGCQLGFPSAFVRITSFMNWILMHV